MYWAVRLLEIKEVLFFAVARLSAIRPLHVATNTPYCTYFHRCGTLWKPVVRVYYQRAIFSRWTTILHVLYNPIIPLVGLQPIRDISVYLATYRCMFTAKTRFFLSLYVQVYSQNAIFSSLYGYHYRFTAKTRYFRHCTAIITGLQPIRVFITVRLSLQVYSQYATFSSLYGYHYRFTANTRYFRHCTAIITGLQPIRDIFITVRLSLQVYSLYAIFSSLYGYHYKFTAYTRYFHHCTAIITGLQPIPDISSLYGYHYRFTAYMRYFHHCMAIITGLQPLRDIYITIRLSLQVYSQYAIFISLYGYRYRFTANTRYLYHYTAIITCLQPIRDIFHHCTAIITGLQPIRVIFIVVRQSSNQSLQFPAYTFTWYLSIVPALWTSRFDYKSRTRAFYVVSAINLGRLSKIGFKGADKNASCISDLFKLRQPYMMKMPSNGTERYF